jgi:hypothetical protein
METQDDSPATSLQVGDGGTSAERPYWNAEPWNPRKCGSDSHFFEPKTTYLSTGSPSFAVPLSVLMETQDDSPATSLQVGVYTYETLGITDPLCRLAGAAGTSEYEENFLLRESADGEGGLSADVPPFLSTGSPSFAVPLSVLMETQDDSPAVVSLSRCRRNIGI